VFVHTSEEGRVLHANTAKKVKVRASMKHRNHETTGTVSINNEPVLTCPFKTVLERIGALSRCVMNPFGIFKTHFLQICGNHLVKFCFSETEETIGATGEWKGQLL